MSAKAFKRSNLGSRVRSKIRDYSIWDQLDGSHPLQELVPSLAVLYPVRQLNKGHVIYFNFQLAREMGLLENDHPDEMNPSLEKKLIETFSVQILNEYDQKRGTKIPSSQLKAKPFMATRYLQLQHFNKQGKTSGDGRSIWNGQVQSMGRSWDVSSRGTGVTVLAPGSVQAKKPLQTGKEEFGYGCGQAEIDELIGSALMAEIMHLQGLHTERVLCVIDLDGKVGIGVRAAPSLLRPAHFFLFLKQNRLQELESLLRYFLQQQSPKRSLTSSKSMSLSAWLLEISKSFAEFAARLEADYIFAWLDWDGDNVLAHAGIIDYGSVRQFGIRHDQYRYDDVERFSTNLNEQRLKARLLVQVFAQMVDAILTREKKPLKQFSQSLACRNFDKEFRKALQQRWLYRLGFTKAQRRQLLKEGFLVQRFEQVFRYFEKAKISGTPKKVSDGINHPALFNVRKALVAIAEDFATHGLHSQNLQAPELFALMLSRFARTRDLQLRPKHRGNLLHFHRLYKMMMVEVYGKQASREQLSQHAQRVRKLNQDDRITGNALINTVDELLRFYRKSKDAQSLQDMISQIIRNFMNLPETDHPESIVQRPRRIAQPELYEKILATIQEHSEDI